MGTAIWTATRAVPFLTYRKSGLAWRRGTGDSTVNRAALADDLERARGELHRLLADAARADAWTKPTRGTRWTNEQLLFHMVFGYMIVQRLLLLVRVMGRLPDRVSRVYARVLDAGTRPFDLINYYGSCAAATVYNRHRMSAKMDRVIASLQRSLEQSTDEALQQRNVFPDAVGPVLQRLAT